MLNTLGIRRLLGTLAAILGVAAVAFAADFVRNPFGACYFEEAGAWETVALTDANGNVISSSCQDMAPGGLLWSSSAAGRTSSGWSYPYAVTGCSNLVEAGYSDWRLPTVKEVQAAVGRDVYHHISTAGIDQFGNPSTPNTTWTSDTKGNKGYWVNLTSGVPFLTLKGSTTDYRCVRP